MVVKTYVAMHEHIQKDGFLCIQIQELVKLELPMENSGYASEV